MSKVKDAWLCIRFTHLSLNSFAIQAGAPQPTVAVVYQDRIWQHNGAASTAIKSVIQNGMTVNHALVLVPDLQLYERQIPQEQQRLQSLAHWAYRFTSLVSIHDNALLLEVGKSISLFKGLNHLINLIYSDLERFKTNADLGFGYTPQAALLLSFQELSFDGLSFKGLNFEEHLKDKASTALFNVNGRLEQAAIAHLNVAEKIRSQLEQCGFRQLRDIMQIAPGDLGNRFGAELLDYLDRLLGRIADIQVPVIPPETFEAHVDFAEPISNIGWIEQQLARLLSDLCVFIKRQQLVCRGFTWRFFDEKNQLLKTAAISLSMDAHNSVNALSASQTLVNSMLELTQLRLATLELSGSFSRIELLSNQLVEKRLFNNDLFDPEPDEEAFKQLLNKLLNRLEQNAVFRLLPNVAHLPELKNTRELATETILTNPLKGNPAKQVSKSTDPKNEFKDQPVWLLDQPKLISRNLRQPEYQGPLHILHGPDRIVSHWWVSLQSRDYYIARQSNGRLLWLFFNRSQRAWFLHGLFG